MDDKAPLYSDIADAPVGGGAYYATTDDGIRIRYALWRGTGAGSVLIFPGRSEYVEKYGRVVAQVTARGYDAVVIDWRGQGLSDRLADDPHIGHVGSFADYQRDLAAVLAEDRVAALPGPRLLLAHSMGGCIAYRALLEGLDVAAAIMTAPMWGINMSPAKQPLAKVLSTLLPQISRGPNYAPGGDDKSYVTTQPFDDNVLTGDAESYAWIQGHLAAHPELGIGGPSWTWLGAALKEMALLHAAKPPDRRFLIFLGSDETVVSAVAIRRLSGRLKTCDLVEIEDARHEVLIETPAIRADVWNRIDRFLAA